MLKKIISSVIALALGASLGTAALAEGPEYASYDEIVSAVVEQYACGWEKDPEALGVSQMFAISDGQSAGWALKDTDGDGTDELLLGENYDGWNVIYDMFAAGPDGKIVHVLTGWDRNRWYIAENGLLVNEGSSGAEDSSVTYYIYADGTLTETEAPSGDVAVITVDFTPFSSGSETASAAIANPWEETDAASVAAVTGVSVVLPERAENVRWYMIREQKLADAEFTLDDTAYSLRFKPTAAFEDISGLYYDGWDVLSATVGGSEATDRMVRDETLGTDTANLLWFDGASGTSYSLTVTEPDLDGFDILGAAEEIFGA